VKRQLSSKRGSIHPTAWTISPLIIVICVLIGILARFAVMSRGHNYDFDSYQIVVSAKHEGLTPWQTNRYNYGPIWSYFLSLFDWIATRTGIGFRLQIVGLLTIADLVIAFFIYRFKGVLLGILFFLNPISVIITGYHNQFDNLAIAIVCISILLMRRPSPEKITWMDLLIVALLGVSLATKHVFIFFTVWIAIAQVKHLKKIFYLSVPIIVFVLTLAPYFKSSWSSINANVIQYQSFNNAPFWTLVGFSNGANSRNTTYLFVILICIFGYFLRNKPLDEKVNFYCIIIVAFSPAIANQYLAIAAVGASGLFNAGFFLYLSYGAFWLATSSDGLGIVQETRLVGKLIYIEPGIANFLQFGYKPFPILLILGLLLHWRQTRVQRLRADLIVHSIKETLT
jgi:hypothetical protein